MGTIVALLAGILGMVLAVFGAAMARLLADEVKAWCPKLTEQILKRAIRKLPAGYRERFEEEWPTDLAATPGDLSKILFALGCAIASWRIMRDVYEPPIHLLTPLLPSPSAKELTIIIPCHNEADLVLPVF